MSRPSWLFYTRHTRVLQSSTYTDRSESDNRHRLSAIDHYYIGNYDDIY